MKLRKLREHLSFAILPDCYPAFGIEEVDVRTEHDFPTSVGKTSGGKNSDKLICRFVVCRWHQVSGATLSSRGNTRSRSA